MSTLIKYLVLPKEISTFEAVYLRRMNRVGLIFFALHVPVMVAVGWLNGTGAALALWLSVAVVVGPALAYVSLANPRTVSVTYGIAAMFMGGVLVHLGQGPVQIEMHFYFFALLAMLAVFGNPMVILVAAATVALHHLVLWLYLPRSIINYDAPLWVIAVHALFVVLESIAGCFIARSFFDNVIGLEKIVRARTTELDARNRDMRLVLDHVVQGFLTVDRRGVPSDERSQIFDRWFPAPDGKEGTLFDFFEGISPEFAERSRVAWDEVVSGFMPLALTLEQMPSRLLVDGRQYSVTYRPIGEGETPARFLVVVTDVSAEVHRALAERDGLETAELFERLLADRGAVETFFEEGAALVEIILGGGAKDISALKRMLHTLKGNSAIFGLVRLSELCHELETCVVDENAAPSANVLAPFRAHWDSLVSRIERLLGTRRHVLEIDESDQEELEVSIRKGISGEPLVRMAHALKLERTQRRLEHIGEQARRVAARLDKSVQVVTDGQELRLDPKYWGGFWSALIHAIRNAVDHGFEPPGERVAQGKPPIGTVALRTYLRGDRFVVEIADDGRGILWDEVARKAAELGMPAATEADLRDALFRDGMTTAQRITDVSGRGLGMGAVRDATQTLGGDLELETELHRGTILRMVFPKDAMTPALRPVGRASSSSTAA